MTATTLSLPPIVTRESFEGVVATSVASKPSAATEVLLDLRAVVFIELAALFCINAYLSEIIESRGSIKIELPEKKNVRDFLVVWQYLESLTSLGDQPFQVYLTPRSLSLLSEPQITYSERGSDISKLEWDPDWQPGSRTRRNFFEFTSFSRRRIGDPEKESDPSIAYPVAESQRWERPLIKAVLNRHLNNGAASDDISKVVIYESISNAVRHPNATLIQTASIFQDSRYNPTKANSGGTFRLCIWDNGDAIPETLSPIAKSGRCIRSHPVIPKYLSEKIFCMQKRFGDTQWHERTPVIDEFDDVNSTQGEEGRLLMFSTFPGVSRDAHVAWNGLTVPELSEPSSPWIGRGMGLYALRRVVVNQLQGALSLRCGAYRIKYSPASQKIRQTTLATSVAEIVSYERSSLPFFKGNLVEITIPLKRKDVDHGSV